jgi:hypothetical protein
VRAAADDVYAGMQMREMELRGERCRVRVARENMEEDGGWGGGEQFPFIWYFEFQDSEKLKGV